MKIIIPVYKPSLNGREKEYVGKCLDSTWISSKGEFLEKFESSFAEYINVKHATAVCNGTIAIHLALLSLGIGPGDEVVVPTLTYISSVTPISYTGATPIFVDSLKDTWQMDPEDIKRKISSKTKAILVVHLYGHPCDMDEILTIAKENKLFIIEDAAEAFGAKYKDKYCGAFGDIATFSFYGNKTITTGEGGMVVTDDATLYDRAVHFKGQGLAKYREYWHDVIGYNYRMTNICSAIGLAQLERANDILYLKRKIAKAYDRGLKGLPLYVHGEKQNVTHSFWMCSILVENAGVRDKLRSHLSEKGIETRPTFNPVHTMPMYCQRYQKHPVAESVGWRGINLPSYPDLSENDVDNICSLIREFYKYK